MPAKKNPLSAEEQKKRFKAEVRRLIDAGELSPTEADAALDKLVRRSASQSDGCKVSE
jgi:polyhydroxyalkanoate synthesis regulator phasin